MYSYFSAPNSLCEGAIFWKGYFPSWQILMVNYTKLYISIHCVDPFGILAIKNRQTGVYYSIFTADEMGEDQRGKPERDHLDRYGHTSIHHVKRSCCYGRIRPNEKITNA